MTRRPARPRRTAGRPRRGLRRHVRRAVPRRLRRRRRRPARRTDRAIATFADGHEEMLVGDAIAESARTGRWVERRATAAHATLEVRPDEARLPDRAVPGDATHGRGRLGGGQRFRGRSRSPAGRRSAGPTRRYAGTSHIDVANLSRRPGARTSAAEIEAQGPRDLRPRLLPEPAAPGSRRPRPGHRPHQARHRGGREDGRAVHEHVHGRRLEEEPGRELGGGARASGPTSSSTPRTTA